MRTPEWAEKLVSQVCADKGVERPALIFWNGSSPHTRARWHQRYRSTGRTTITVTPGTDGYEHDALLHELAHHLSPAREHHGWQFWKMAFDLFEQYGSEVVEQFVVREFGYRQGAAAEAMHRPNLRWRELARLWAAKRAEGQAIRYEAAASGIGRMMRTGDRVKLVPGQLRGATGQTAVVVEVKYTRALIRLEAPIGSWPAGAKVLAPMRCLEVI